jgi:hypothetical protein
VTLATGDVCASGSSTAVVDAERGVYAVFLIGYDEDDSTLTVDVVQWLVGEDAVEAWQAQHPEDPGGPPNDYFIVNESAQTRTFVFADAVEVRVLEQGAVLIDASLAQLRARLDATTPGEPGDDRLSYNPWWIAVNDGAITHLCEQYIP